ncbi:hypothetical protein [Saccharothrix yanglingensis]|uniref:Uncharacterized protein n=1 Tax=Saccharothrix yanglingensis TaxID=659496 RepID=A0ABU0WTX8_9PSEU|nr:hypothetical protein [Saccharothrix yanglingensis]MDQ2583300.1 hypothetical protein [Saccharothrix yanglingensis]
MYALDGETLREAAEGLTARGMPPDDPVRVRVEAATDRAAARPLRPLGADVGAGLLDALRALRAGPVAP